MVESGPIGSDAEAVERSMWEGTRLPDHLRCDCKQDHPHHRSGYEEFPIIRAAHEYPAGSSSFLETNFQPAFQPVPVKSRDRYEVTDASPEAHDRSKLSNQPRSWISMLGHQTALPHVSYKQQDTLHPTLHAQLICHVLPCLRISLNPPPTSVPFPTDGELSLLTPIARLCLFKVNLATDLMLVAKAHFQRCSGMTHHLVVGFYTKAITADTQKGEETEYELFSGKTAVSYEAIFNLNAKKPNSRIVEIGLYCKSPHYAYAPQDILDLYNLVIKPAFSNRPEFVINDLEIYHRSSGNDSEQRLKWMWSGLKESWPTGLPWSELTGPFSHFTILAGGEELGQAHCQEFPLRRDCFGDMGESDRNIGVIGHLFGGGEVSSALLAGRGGLHPSQDPGSMDRSVI